MNGVKAALKQQKIYLSRLKFRLVPCAPTVRLLVDLLVEEVSDDGEGRPDNTRRYFLRKGFTVAK
jgi:hypothetical protein